MEFEALSEEVELEARRVAAAFGVKEWATDGNPLSIRGVGEAGFVVVWGIDPDTAKFIGVQINGSDRKISHIYDDSRFQTGATTQPLWNCSFSPMTAYSMSRGLYRLGIEDEGVLAELNHPLSAHEKLELRFSLPRQFWPKKWLDEEAQ